MAELRPKVVITWILISFAFAPLIAFSANASGVQPYFNGYSADGGPIRADNCGVNHDKKGWLGRHFEDGVRSEIGIAYEAKQPLTATLLFRYSDEKYGKFEILPEAIRLYIHPGDKVVKPSSIERKPLNPEDKHCDILQLGEWITLTFPVQQEQAEQVALVFPSGTVSKRDPINVRPFRFERIDHSVSGVASPTKSAISVPVLPPVGPRFASFESASAMASDVKGSWILDTSATEELISKIPRPANAEKLAQWFGLASGYMALFIYEFDGNFAKASAFRGTKVLEFERVSDQDTETSYAQINTTDSKPQTLSVSVLKDGNIRIVPSASPEISYLRWKPGHLKTETANPDDVMAIAQIWLESVQRIVKTLNTPPKPPIEKNPANENSSGPQAALDEAVRRGIVRKATADDVRAFRDAYVEKRYTSKNLPVPGKEDALSVTKVDISRAYVVLGKFAYPPGMVGENRVVFFIPKGVPEPSGEWGHSAFYDFETLTVGCTAARTGGFGC
jgi:hypothetical protein